MILLRHRGEKSRWHRAASIGSDSKNTAEDPTQFHPMQRPPTLIYPSTGERAKRVQWYHLTCFADRDCTLVQLLEAEGGSSWQDH